MVHPNWWSEAPTWMERRLLGAVLGGVFGLAAVVLSGQGTLDTVVGATVIMAIFGVTATFRHGFAATKTRRGCVLLMGSAMLLGFLIASTYR